MKQSLKGLFLIVIILSACSLQAETSFFANSFISQNIQVYGIAGMPWEKSMSLEEERARAWVDALHHAYEKILDLPLMEGKLVRHVFQTNSGLKSRLGMVLMAAKKTFYTKDQTGLIRCKLDVPFNGKQSIRSALYLAALRPQPIRPISLLASWSRRLKPTNKVKASKFVRMVVDLRNTNYQPSLFPRFFDDKGYLVFQETMLPSHKRFSRPIVKFTENIRDAYKDIDEEKVMIVDGTIPNLVTRDVAVVDTEATIFARFCEDIVKNPLGKKEILLVFSTHNIKTGKLSKKKKEATKENKNKK